MFEFYSELADVENFVEKFGIETLSARDKHGYTPAHWVALDGNVDMMRYLVDQNAPIDLRCLGTQGFEFEKKETKCKSISLCFYCSSKGPRPIHWSCRKGNVAVVQVLLQAGVNVNAADLKGLY